MRSQDIPSHLHARYGIRPPSPWRWVALAAAALVVLPVGLYAASRYVATQQVPYALISWAAERDTRVRVLWQLDAVDERRWCALRAQDFERFDVGFAVVPVPAGATEMSYRLSTTARPTAVDVLDCESDPYALPGPQFPPGVLPPRQPAPGFAPGAYAPEQLGVGVGRPTTA